MLHELIEDFRKRTDPHWENLRERRVLLRVERTIERRKSLRRAYRRALASAVALSLGAALVRAYVVGFDVSKGSVARTREPAAVVALGSRPPIPRIPDGAAPTGGPRADLASIPSNR